jgi:hypothetical protein
MSQLRLWFLVLDVRRGQRHGRCDNGSTRLSVFFAFKGQLDLDEELTLNGMNRYL